MNPGRTPNVGNPVFLDEEGRPMAIFVEASRTQYRPRLLKDLQVHDLCTSVLSRFV